ncbi:MAG TPA: hypothetical protein DC038_01135 [Clostridiales bacterium]|nr:hypothetical protein [Clostridiales bacterium]
MKSKKVKSAVIVAAILIVAAVVINTVAKKASAADAGPALSAEAEHTVSMDNISISVSDSGSITPTDKRIIKSEINGTVDGIYVTEGDQVEKDQVLIALKSDTANDSRTEIRDIELNIEKAQKDLNNLYENNGNLNIYAPSSGVISGLNIKAGDQISSNYTIANIKDTDNSYLEVYFTKNEFDKISVGDTASIFMTKYFSTQTGTVTEKDSTPVQKGGGIFGYLVTVKMKNPGGYSVGDLAQISVTNSQGTYNGMENGKIADIKEEKTVSKISGKVKSVSAENGKYINAGDLIATLEGEDISLQIAEKQNAIQKYQSQMKDLAERDTVYSPMKGTVLKIDVSEEEVVDRTTALMTVADLESMEVKISVDELDINKIKLGQQASITSDVYPDEKFTGKVSKISMEGNSQNGVTTYDVTIKLDDRKSLMSGMNVNVEILAESRENVLTVPVGAVRRMQGEYMVSVKDSSGSVKNVKVELGLATKDKVEITSGLSEGDIVLYSRMKSESSQFQQNGNVRIGMPGMSGGAVGVPAGGGNTRSGGGRQ